MQRTITAAEWKATPRVYRVTKGHRRYVLKMKGGEVKAVPVKIKRVTHSERRGE